MSLKTKSFLRVAAVLAIGILLGTFVPRGAEGRASAATPTAATLTAARRTLYSERLS